jgi:hypothetical protein
MAEAWYVRVEEKEYGPVDLETLRQWKAEGRLIPQNPVRAADDEEWKTATDIPDLFVPAPPPVPSGPGPSQLYQRRSFGQIIAQSFRIYRTGFGQFFALSLLIGLPSLGLQICMAYVHYSEGQPVGAPTQIASAIAIVMLVVILVSWPIFVAGLQFAAGELAAGRRAPLGEILRRAVNHWPRVARLSLVVYGSYLFWSALPVLAILSLASVPSVLSILLALLLLVFQVYMTGRLFINFLFWQQASTLGGLAGAEALIESRELARSRKSASALERPLWRGALIASVWLLILIAVSVATELPFMMVRLQGIASFEQGYDMIMKLSQAATPDWLTIASDVLSSLVHAVLRPLLGIAFVVLYFDAKGR